MKNWMFLVGLAPSLAFASSEPRKTETGLPERWAGPDVTVVLDPSLEDLGPGATDAFREAITTWRTDVVGLPRVAFEVGTTRGVSAYDGKSVILAGPITLEGHQTDLAVTTTYADDRTGDIVEADILFNTRYAFAAMPTPTPECAHVFDIGAVATHESGHFFGLGEDYEDLGATMYPITAACDAHKRALTASDTDAIALLYAPPTALVAHCDAAPAPRKASAAVFVGLCFALAGFARRMSRHDARRCDRARPRG